MKVPEPGASAAESYGAAILKAPCRRPAERNSAPPYRRTDSCQAAFAAARTVTAHRRGAGLLPSDRRRAPAAALLMEAARPSFLEARGHRVGSIRGRCS